MDCFKNNFETVRVVWKYLNFTTPPEDLLPISMLLFYSAFCLWDMNVYNPKSLPVDQSHY